MPKLFSLFFKISLGLVIFLSQFWFLVNAPAFWPDNTIRYQILMIVYILMFTSMFAIPNLRLKLMSINLRRGFEFITWFVGTIVVLAFVSNFILGKILPISTLITVLKLSFITVVMHSLYVALVEEYVFRDFTFNQILKTSGSKTFAIIMANLSFGAFHWSVYGFGFLNMLFASVIGVVLSLIKLRYDKHHDNLEITGVHAGLNVFTSGVLGKLGRVATEVVF